MKTYFDHEKVDVYREAIGFCGWVGDLLNDFTSKAAAKDQLDRASTSLPLNIAEGNGKLSDADRSRFLEIARGSALECAACLDVLVVRKLVAAERIVPAKSNLCASLTCSWDCSKGFLGVRNSCAKKKDHTLTSMSMIMSTRLRRATSTSRSTNKP